MDQMKQTSKLLREWIIEMTVKLRKFFLCYFQQIKKTQSLEPYSNFE